MILNIFLLAEQVAESQIPWVQIVIALIVGATGAGFASVLKAIFGKKLSDAKADAQILHNAQEIINELRKQKDEMEEDFRERISELNTKISELNNEIDWLKRSLREERRLAQEESARLRMELNEKDAELNRFRRGQ